MFEIIEYNARGLDRRIHERTIDTLIMLYKEGKTLEQLGYFLGVTRERIRQLLVAEGITSKDGGARTRKQGRLQVLKQQRLASRKKTEAKMEAIFRCSYEELIAICGMPVTYGTIQSSGTPQCGYYTQKRNAENRGIPWEITFPEWWKVWQESGHWIHRGRGKSSYCMSRKLDQGPYRVDNVEVMTNLRNATEGQVKFDHTKRYRDELGLIAVERRVYDLVKAGFSSPTVIAEKLGMKASTVGQIKQNLKKKLGIFNGVQRVLKD